MPVADGLGLAELPRVIIASRGKNYPSKLTVTDKVYVSHLQNAYYADT